MRFICRFLVVFGLFIVSVPLLAQNDACPSIVETALQNVSDQCDEIGRNQVCYGNIQLDVTTVTNASDFSFDTPGDIVDVAIIETLKLSVLQSPDEWGIALMKIQANLPDTLPGQNVTMLLFGDVFVENLADADDDNDVYGPMQAIVFRNGVGEPGCEEAPPDGILIQTPDGVGQVTLDINDVHIELGSTAFINAVPGAVMQITLLEGEAVVTAQGVSVTIPAGLRAEIPLDADGLASGIPALVPYEAEEVATLPIANLDEPFELPEPLSSTDSSIDGNSAVSGFLTPQPGVWCNLDEYEDSCDDLSALIFDVSEEGITADIAGFIPRVGENSYALNRFDYGGSLYSVEVEIVSTTEIIITIYDHDYDDKTVSTLVYSGD